jgi:hypothetical protein
VKIGISKSLVVVARELPTSYVDKRDFFRKLKYGNGVCLGDWCVANYHTVRGMKQKAVFITDPLTDRIQPVSVMDHPYTNHTSGAWVSEDLDIALWQKPGGVHAAPRNDKFDWKTGTTLTLFSWQDQDGVVEMVESTGPITGYHDSVRWTKPDGTWYDGTNLWGVKVSSVAGMSGGIFVHNNKVVGILKGANDQTAFAIPLSSFEYKLAEKPKNVLSPGSEVTQNGSGTTSKTGQEQSSEKMIQSSECLASDVSQAASQKETQDPTIKSS